MSFAGTKIVALGAGRMGRSIAVVFAYAGLEVTVLDAKPRDAAGRAATDAAVRSEVAAHLRALRQAEAMDEAAAAAIEARIGVAGLEDAAAVLGAADIVFEGVPEVMAAKQAALALAGAQCRADAIIASTTSTILVDTLAAFVPGPARFLNAHWLNPAYIIPLVELSPGAATAPEVVARMKALLEAVGKVPVVCAAAPGFIVPRIQALAMNEAARMVEQGLATAEDIDKATRYGLGFRFAVMGLTEFIDFGGGDILHYASAYLAEALGDDRYVAPAIIGDNMLMGRIGMKTGQGFHDWSGDTAARRRDEVLARLMGMLRHNGLLKPPGAALE